MSLWKLILPVTTWNMVLNPSAEIAGNFGNNGVAGVAVTADATYAFRGLKSYKVVNGAAVNCAMSVTLSALIDAIHYINFWSRDTLTDAYSASFYTAAPALIGSVTPVLLNTEGSWRQYGVAVPAATAYTGTGAVTCYISNTTASRTWYIDAVQVEPLATWSTYCDGDQDGCAWSGTRHGSYSVRTDQVRSGGYVKDLDTDYSVHVLGMKGYGGPVKESMLDPLAFVDGSVYQGTRASGRILELTVDYAGTTLANAYTLRKAFMSAISRHLTVPQQPVTWRYYGPGKTVELRAFVESGDEGVWLAGEGFREVMPLQLMAVEDPYWQELAEASASLNNSTTLAVEQMVAYRPSQPWSATTGYWDALGAPEIDSGDLGTIIYCWAKDKAGNLYVGGDFLNLNGVAEADYIAKRSAAGVWSALGSGTGSRVYALAVAPDGTLYAGGHFTNLTDGSGDYISHWTGAAWESMGTGLQADCYSLLFSTDGKLYAGGNFTAAGGVANTAKFARWTGAAWEACHASATDGVVRALAEDTTYIYAAGDFGNLCGVAAVKVGRYNKSTSTASAMGAGLTGGVNAGNALAVGPDGKVYAGGVFTTAGVVAASNIAAWTGAAWEALGAGVNAVVWAIAVTQGNLVFVSGEFTSAGGIALGDRIAVWQPPTSWSALPIDLPGTPQPYALLVDGNDIYFGFDTEGNATLSGISSAAAGSITNNGTAPCYPVIEIACTVLKCTLQEVRNASTGHVIRFNREMQVGETITIDTRTGKESVTSDFPSPNGSTVNMLMPSDLGTFYLKPGVNYVSAYAPGTGATVTVSMRWRIKHDGAEGGAT